MKLEQYLIPENLRSNWLIYPAKLIDLINAGRVDLTPWNLLNAESALKQQKLLKERYDRQLIPFAYRKNNDNLACFEVNCGEKIKIVDYYSTKGWENDGEFLNFDEWLSDVENEMKDW